MESSIIENPNIKHPLTSEMSLEGKYGKDFQSALQDFKPVLTEKEFNRLLKKTQLGPINTLNQHLQFSAEFTVVYYIIRNYRGFKYEPQYNGKKNPECSFEYEGRTINVEVKCPDFSKRIDQESVEGIKSYAVDRLPTKEAYSQTIKTMEKSGVHIQSMDRLDNKLKDFLISAHSKFPDSNILNFNVLVIALETNSDMDEWYSYLSGPKGAFTDSSYITENYSNVDAVLITNLQAGHHAIDNGQDINRWKLENYISLLFLNPLKEKCYGLGDYYKNKAIDLFGMQTRDFLQFLKELDEINQAQDNDTNNIISSMSRIYGQNLIKYIFSRYDDSHIISKWAETLKK